MDRNSIVGLVLIGVILIGYSIITKPSREAQMEAMRKADSIAKVDHQERIEAQKARGEQPVMNTDQENPDSLQRKEVEQRYGDFAVAVDGEKKLITVENERMILEFSTLGGRPYSVTLKDYQTYDSLPVKLFYGDSSRFDLQFFAENRRINTGELYFTPDTDQTNIQVTSDQKTITFRMDVATGAAIEYIYTIYPRRYMIDFDIRLIGLDQYRADNLMYAYELYFPSTEKGFQNENNYTSLFYRYKAGDIEKFSMRSKKSIEEETATTQLEWIAYKHQFFSTVLIANDHFEGAYMYSERFDDPGKYIRHFSSEIDMPYNRSGDETISMKFYFGPNEYKTLQKYHDLGIDNLVTVGGSMIRWINAYAIIPIFNWLDNFIGNYGIIILLLTLIIKVVLFPLTYRSYKSQAVMRVLKPQVDEISAKYPKKEDAMKKQQATMDLYKRAGANPLGGCLPMLLQFPILYAMFRFFPTSIELRQQSFLWADDLSTYDSILNLPFEIPMYGDHVSLFTLLMTVTTILSMRINNQTQSSAAMPGMKTMMYIMPVMFMLILNNFSAALTYYYFLANLITLIQNFLFKRFTDEDKILKKINSKKAKPVKKSKWQQRLETMTKQQQQLQKGKKR
jgi:YidC/Oxa1 family membrane protein insertase